MDRWMIEGWIGRWMKTEKENKDDLNCSIWMEGISVHYSVLSTFLKVCNFYNKFGESLPSSLYEKRQILRMRGSL